MNHKQPQLSFFLALSCLVVAICVLVVVGGSLFRGWTGGPVNVVRQDSSHELRRFSSEDLTAQLADHLPVVLDDGRVQIAPPKDWSLEPRSKEYLARFIWRRNAPLPRITMEAGEANFEEPNTVDELNLLEFQELVIDALSKDQSSKLLDYRPLVLGGVPCASYTLRIKGKFAKLNRVVEFKRHVIKTLREGRIYTTILDVFDGTLGQHQRTAYAVVAGLKFVDEQAGDLPEKTPPSDVP